MTVSRCPYCHWAVGEDAVTCPQCGSVHHADCWEEHGSCARDGYVGAPDSPAPEVPVAAAPPPAAPAAPAPVATPHPTAPPPPSPTVAVTSAPPATAPVAELVDVFCTSCGHRLDEGVRFCTSCGYPAGGAT